MNGFNQEDVQGCPFENVSIISAHYESGHEVRRILWGMIRQCGYASQTRPLTDYCPSEICASHQCRQIDPLRESIRHVFETCIGVRAVTCLKKRPKHANRIIMSSPSIVTT